MSTSPYGPWSGGPGGGDPDPWRPPQVNAPTGDGAPDGAHQPNATGGHQTSGYYSSSPWASPGGPATGPHWSAPAAGWGQPEGARGVATAEAPFGSVAPARPDRQRGLVITMLVLVVVILALVVGLLAFAVGPRFARTNVLDRSAVEQGVAGIVTQDWRRKVDAVRCPPDQPARAGTSFSCSATIDGRPQQVPVDVLDERGLYQVGQPR